MGEPNYVTFGDEVPRTQAFTITNDQILTIPNAPYIEIVPSPEDDQYILPMFVDVIQDFTGGAYDNLQTGSVFADIGYIVGPSSFIAFSGSPLNVEGAMIDFENQSEWIITPSSQTGTVGRLGKPLGFIITNASENFTEGNEANTLKGVIYYSIRTIE